MKKAQTFAEKVKEVVRKIPRGKVFTYGEVAKRAGQPKGARAVGMIMSKNFDTHIPCHRVVRSDGSLGSYNRGGQRQKRKILIAEGALKS